MVSLEIYEHNVANVGGGVELKIKEFRYKAEKSGKILYIQAGLHGGETSQWCLYKLHDYLLANLEEGEVRIVPYANQAAWLQRVYGHTFGKFSMADGKDFNRCFCEKNESFNERLCSCLLKMTENVDFVVDLHTSKKSLPFIIFTQKKYEKIIKACGMKYNQYSDDANIVSLYGTFNAALDRRGIANITIECGGHDEFVEKNEEMVFAAICRIMQEMSLIKKKEQNTFGEIFVFEKREKIYAECSGLFKPERQLRDNIKQGEIIGKIYNSADLSDVKDVVCHQDGIVHNFMCGHIVWEGDVVCEIIPAADIKLLQ